MIFHVHLHLSKLFILDAFTPVPPLCFLGGVERTAAWSEVFLVLHGSCSLNSGENRETCNGWWELMIRMLIHVDPGNCNHWSRSNQPSTVDGFLPENDVTELVTMPGALTFPSMASMGWHWRSPQSTGFWITQVSFGSHVSWWSTHARLVITPAPKLFWHQTHFLSLQDVSKYLTPILKHSNHLQHPYHPRGHLDLRECILRLLRRGPKCVMHDASTSEVPKRWVEQVLAMIKHHFWRLSPDNNIGYPTNITQSAWPWVNRYASPLIITMVINHL